MSQQALRKVQSQNDIAGSSSERKFNRDSKSDSIKSQDDKNSSSNSSTDQDAEKKIEFYSNIYTHKIVLNVSIDTSELMVTGNEQYTLLLQYPDLQLKQFPRKKIFSSFKQKTIESRMKMLNEFLAAVFEAFGKRQMLLFLDFIEIQEQFIKRGILDFFREQANSSILLKQHVDIVNSVSMKPSSEQEQKMIQILQKLNAFSDSVTCGFDKLSNFYFKEQPSLNRNFIPLILIGEDKLKGIIELSLQITKENADSHLVCCQGLKVVLDLMDIQKNPSAQQFIDIYTSITFQDMKKFNFRAHILNKNAKECKTYALKLLKIFVDAHAKTLSKVTRQLLMDDKTFEEYVKYFRIQNVPRQLVSKVMLEILEEEQNTEFASVNEHQSMNVNRISNQYRSMDIRDRLMFNRNSVLDKNSNTFAEARYTMNGQNDSCDFEELKEAIDDPSIEWRHVYCVEDSFSFRHCDQPDKFILISFYLPLSLADAQVAVIENRKDWDTLFMENKKFTLSNEQPSDDVYKESYYNQRYSGMRMLSFIYKRKYVESNDSVYIFKEPVQNPEYKPHHHEDLGKWYQCVKFTSYKNDRKLRRFNNMQDSSTTFSIEDDEDDSKSYETLSQNEQPITKVDLIIKCCDNNSVIYTSPFLLNDNKQVVDNILTLIESTSKQISGKSTFDQSLNESNTPNTPK